MSVKVWSPTNKKIQLFGVDIRQSWMDLFFINQVLTREKFDYIIELGTGKGMLTIFFAVCCDCPVFTVDILEEPTDDVYNKVKQMYPITFQRGNCFKDPIKEKILGMLNKNRCLLYCDNGNKIRELETYAPSLTQGDVIMVHDKHVEAPWEKIAETVRVNHLIEFYGKESNYLNTSIWSFIKR